MDLPRIHFAGHFRADPNTRNNINCNYDQTYGIDNNPSRDYNFNGTGEFSFFNSKVTSVVTEDGLFSTTDPIVNSPVVNNENMSFPKLVDLDVDYQLIKATVYGMTFGVNWQEENGTQTLAFQGAWGLNVIAQDVWSRAICIDVNSVDESHRYGSHSTTVLSNVTWGDVSKSPALQQLRDAVEIENDRSLSVSMTLFFYTRNYPSYLFENFTLGYVVGSIGTSKPNEPANFGGDRLLSFEDVKQPHLPLEETDSCFRYQGSENHPHWMYKAPFQVNDEYKMVTVDLSNSLPQHLHGGLRQIGDLWLGIINARENCIDRIGDRKIPYMVKHWLEETGGVIDVKIRDEQFKLLQSSKLVLVRQMDMIEFEMWNYQELNIAQAPLNRYVECSDDSNIFQIMLQETSRYIRPMNYYVTRLEYQESFDMKLLVSSYGKPVVSEPVYLHQSNSDRALPPGGVVPSATTVLTDENGIATYTFQVEEKIPFPREYPEPQPPCNLSFLPIEGQVYTFNYTVNGTCTGDVNNNVTYLSCSNEIAILAFSHLEPPQNPDWVHDVAPIFQQYDRITPVMHQMINLSNYTEVVNNKELIQLAMELNFNHPSYMPATRDLSPTKQKMILKWFQNPIYNTSNPDGTEGVDEPRKICNKPPTMGAVSNVETYFAPPRCLARDLTGLSPDDSDFYFRRIFENTQLDYKYAKRPRPLWRAKLMAQVDGLPDDDTCTLGNLLTQLQYAVELEFATLPVYLTSLYSIVEGCNQEVYDLIYSVIMQEMLHLVQAANILIAVGGTPIIDSKNTVPTYPTIGLPGGVLPHLRVTLEKASLIHIYKVFMGIEVPHNTSVDHLNPQIFNDTIGQFYGEIELCIEQLGDGIFVGGGRPDQQVQWPWDSGDVGTVYTVTNVASAKQAINQIVEQGEGANPLDPTYNNTGELAHFYKFEEIVCQKHLILVNESGKPQYRYAGAEISFEPAGVWQMRDNPSKNCIPPNNNCYTEAKAFHAAFRALLRKLQHVFNGQPNGIREALTNMESLGVHARKLMWTKVSPSDDLTCGPVWDYDWDD